VRMSKVRWNRFEESGWMLQGTQQGECEEIQQRIAAINNSG
jgi:Zn-dependent oligopeptidase